jgi:NAD(P)H-hydrate repair Nnr-like enzyme with NAD(P)H-hydrate dehydratase domain
MKIVSLGAFEAAAAGAHLHGVAGELARRTYGAAGMVAGNVSTHLPEAWNLICASSIEPAGNEKRET